MFNCASMDRKCDFRNVRLSRTGYSKTKIAVPFEKLFFYSFASKYACFIENAIKVRTVQVRVQSKQQFIRYAHKMNFNQINFKVEKILKTNRQGYKLLSKITCKIS